MHIKGFRSTAKLLKSLIINTVSLAFSLLFRVPKGRLGMHMIKSIFYGFILYIAIPACLFFFAYQVTERNPETMEIASNFIKENLNPTFLQKIEETFGTEKKDDAEEIPLIKAQNNTNAVVADAFLQQEEEKPAEAALPEKNINKIPLEYADQTFTSEDIIQDKLNRLPYDFKVPAGLKQRILFWFDIYTKYSSHFSIIHDEDRPWIIYKVVDLRDIYDARGNIFTKDFNDHKRMASEKAAVRKALLNLAKKKSYDNLTTEEFKYFKLLEEVPGNRKKIFKYAANHFRPQRGQKDFYRNGIISGAKYINEMEEVFARYDLPTELVRLPLVESSFNEDAISKVGASGIWQFMLGTGKHYMQVGERIDERNSPIKATEAAAQLFLSNHKILKTWPLAITAYNHGAGGLIKAGKKLKTTDLAEIISKFHTKSFSFASQNFYSEYMAALYAEKYQEEIFGALPKSAPLAADAIRLKKSMRVRDIAEIAGVTLEEIKLHNPDLRKHVLAGNPYLPIGFKIRLPLGRSARLELYYQQLSDLKAVSKRITKKKST